MIGRVNVVWVAYQFHMDIGPFLIYQEPKPFKQELGYEQLCRLWVIPNTGFELLPHNRDNMTLRN